MKAPHRGQRSRPSARIRMALCALFGCLSIFSESTATTTGRDPEESAHRIAIVLSRPISPYQDAISGFRMEVEAGTPGATFDVYDVSQETPALPPLVDRLNNSNCDLVLTVGTEAYRSVAKGGLAMPVVAAMVYDPESEFEIDSSRETETFGVPLRVPIEVQLRTLKNLCPKITRVSAIYLETSGTAPTENAKSVAASLGLQIVPIPIASLNELESGLDQAKEQSDAFLMLLDPQMYTKATTRNILEFFLRARVPVVSFSPNYVKAGALLSVSSGYRENGSTAGQFASRILGGERITNRFIPTRSVRTDWNRQAASALGIALEDEQRKLITELH